MREFSSVYHAFRESASEHATRTAVIALQDHSERSMTYAELLNAVDAVAAHLREKGLRPGQTVALMVHNAPEWAIMDLAVAREGGIVVPIHVTYTPKYVSYILEHAECSFACIDAKLWKTMRTTLEEQRLRHVYVVGDIIDAEITTLNVYPFAEMVSFRTDPSEAYTPQPDDVHTIVYTSGTTGHPKGVMLTHKNILSNVSDLLNHIQVYVTDRFFSFLPLSHILERTAGHYVPLLSGASVYYARSIETLSEDMQRVKPTIVISVPRIFERVHEKILAKLSSNSLVHALFRMAHRAAVHKLRRRLSLFEQLMYHIGEKLIFHKVRAAFGGDLRFAVSGGAALAKHIAEFFESLGILVLEGYGLTETSPVLTANTVQKYRFGTVGIPLASVQLHITPTGEICAKGTGIMKGYYKAPDLTEQVFDDEGWFHTGDLGSVDADGFLTIIGRLKEMIVLSTGRNVFPVPIEQALEESPYISQAMVYGDNQRAISAFIVPEFRLLEEWCRKQDIAYSFPAVATDLRVKEFFAQEIRKMLEHFQSFEQVRDFKILTEKFTVENDMLTLSQKLKRRIIIERSQDA